ncbi:anthranilate phosphoribosyltransferase chloroplastic [Tripterygium wilfordii]|uniref:Anthranilate phosphoribosyltransferase chloroplastic n=1 Tax=Tripterygium wilfordii TaxID=458696 RepID=A0A7J7CDF3_TRIWF|nr:anthranilate phosphoribosyltransferase chloroplastic [Tripterygium wilfordii]
MAVACPALQRPLSMCAISDRTSFKVLGMPKISSFANPVYSTRLTCRSRAGENASLVPAVSMAGVDNSTREVMPFNELIESLINRVDLSESEAKAALEYLLNDADEALISAFLVLLRAKGETYEEVVGLARAMLNHATKVEAVVDAVDIVGTGGDGANTVNISTGSSILAAACGAPVAKQGNRSSSSACGSADVLEALGVAIDLDPVGVRRCLDEVGIGFMMAPKYHPAMKIVRSVRKKLKVKTVFNILGPMLNPARVPYAVVGVYTEDLVSACKCCNSLDILRKCHSSCDSIIQTQN